MDNNTTGSKQVTLSQSHHVYLCLFSFMPIIIIIKIKKKDMIGIENSHTRLTYPRLKIFNFFSIFLFLKLKILLKINIISK